MKDRLLSIVLLAFTANIGIGCKTKAMDTPSAPKATAQSESENIVVEKSPGCFSTNIIVDGHPRVTVQCTDATTGQQLITKSNDGSTNINSTGGGRVTVQISDGDKNPLEGKPGVLVWPIDSSCINKICNSILELPPGAKLVTAQAKRQGDNIFVEYTMKLGEENLSTTELYSPRDSRKKKISSASISQVCFASMDHALATLSCTDLK